MSDFKSYLKKETEMKTEVSDNLTEASGEVLYNITYDKASGLEIKSSDGKQTIWLEGMSSKEDKTLAEVAKKLKGMDLSGSFNIRV